MNVVMSSGRLTADPRISNSGDLMIARYSLALDRPVRRDAPEGTRTADFPNYVVFGKGAEFAEKYLRKGMKIIVQGHLQTSNYQREDGTTDTLQISLWNVRNLQTAREQKMLRPTLPQHLLLRHSSTHSRHSNSMHSLLHNRDRLLRMLLLHG